MTQSVFAVGGGTALQDGRSRVPFPVESLGFFIELIFFGRIVVLVSTHPLTEMSTRNILGVKTASAQGW
jgi:hypothetical protein